MTVLVDLECLRPVTILCVLTAHAPPQQLGLCTSRPKKFEAALQKLRNRSCMIHSRLFSVTILAWVLYQLAKAIIANKQYSFYGTIAVFSLPQLTMFAKLWINGGNHEIQNVLSKLTEVDELLVKSRDERPGYWVKRSCRYAAFIVIFYLFNSLLYVYSILQFLNSTSGDIDGFTVLLLHILSNVVMLEFLSFVSLIKNRFQVLNCQIAEFSNVPVDRTSNKFGFKSGNKQHQALSTKFHRELHSGGEHFKRFHRQSHVDDSWVGDENPKNRNLLVKIKTIYNSRIGSVDFSSKTFPFQSEKSSTDIAFWESRYFKRDGGCAMKASLEPKVVHLKEDETCNYHSNSNNTQHHHILEECSEGKVLFGQGDALKLQGKGRECSSMFGVIPEHGVTMEIISGLSKRLDFLRLAHHSLNEFSDLVNRRYSVFLLSEVCAVFMVLVVCAHIVLNIQTLTYMIGRFTVLSMIIWIFVTMTRLIIMIFCCRGVIEESSKSVHLVTTPHTNPDVQSLWDVFSLQLVHCGCVQFNAGGVFPIRLELIFSIVGATATYLIVLQQYNDIKI